MRPSFRWDLETQHPWGNDIAGKNEQALAIAFKKAQRQLEGVICIAFPWSLFHRAITTKKDGMVRELKIYLNKLLATASSTQPSKIITCYAGSQPEWAYNKINSYQVINAVFSCLISTDIKRTGHQDWHPISMPCPNFPIDNQSPERYKKLHRIWKSIQKFEHSSIEQGDLILPGNQSLWKQYFSGERPKETARLIAEEHYGNHSVIQIIRILASQSCLESFTLDANNLKLSHAQYSCFNQSKTKQDDFSELRQYHLNRPKSHRTPLAYQQISCLSKHFYYNPSHSSIAITGGLGDQNSSSISLCISEEPWWDLQMRSGQYKPGETGYLDGFFDNLSIPYYLAVNPLIMDRIRLRLEILASRSLESILQQLLRAKVQYLGIHAYRLRESQVGHVKLEIADQNVFPLSGLRTKIGIHARSRGLGLTHGKGWGVRGFEGFRRDAYTDWHLDKLSLINSKSPLLGMAMENVHHKSYITEKSFDMLCSCVIPVTCVSPDHVLHRYLLPNSHLNVYGLGLRQILDALEKFEVTPSIAEAFKMSATNLANLFGSKKAISSTLEEVAARCDQWILTNLQSSFL